MSIVTTFPNEAEFKKAIGLLEKLSLPFKLISPQPGFGKVGVGAIVLDDDIRMEVSRNNKDTFICSGWVEYYPETHETPQAPPEEFEEDKFGNVAIMVYAECAADHTKVRLVAHISGDCSEVFPYLNTEMPGASFNVNGPTFSFMNEYRMVTLYPQRIGIAKADGIVDTWRILEMLRTKINSCWKQRANIVPSYNLRHKPPALEIFKRLPKINCKLCGEPTCWTFALKLWSGTVRLNQCKEVFEGNHGHLKEPLLQVCAGLGTL